MNRAAKTPILAIAPNSRGFGFVLFLTPTQLVDWGIKEARRDKNARCMALATALIARYQPIGIMLEDWLHETCRRSARVKMLLTELGKLAADHGIAVHSYSRRQVRDVFAGSGMSKDAIAATIADMVPGLLPWLPRKRRIWESEQHSMAIFEAAALVLTHYALRDKVREKDGDRCTV